MPKSCFRRASDEMQIEAGKSLSGSYLVLFLWEKGFTIVRYKMRLLSESFAIPRAAI